MLKDLFVAMKAAGMDLTDDDERRLWSVGTFALFGTTSVVAALLARVRVPELLQLSRNTWINRAIWIWVAAGLYGAVASPSTLVRVSLSITSAPGIVLFIGKVIRFDRRLCRLRGSARPSLRPRRWFLGLWRIF